MLWLSKDVFCHEIRLKKQEKIMYASGLQSKVELPYRQVKLDSTNQKRHPAWVALHQ